MIWKIIRLNPYLIMKMVLMNGLWSGRIWINVKNGERKEDENATILRLNSSALIFHWGGAPINGIQCFVIYVVSQGDF
jgi:hypothetical protein